MSDSDSEETPLLPKVDFTFETLGSDSAFRVRRFELEEALNDPYHCVLDLLSQEVGANVPALLGSSCTLAITRGPLRRTVHGVVFRVDDHGTTGGRVAARIHFAPALWGTGHGENTRVFQGLTAPQIVQAVLKAPLLLHHRRCELRLSETYPERDICVQYHESDLAFVRRLMEEEGISLFFDQSGTAELVVLVDSNSIFPTCTTLDGRSVPASGQSGASGQIETLFEFGAAGEMGPTRVAVLDFDWTRPALDLSETNEHKEGDGPDFEIFEHSPRAALSAYSEREQRYTRQHQGARAKVALERATARSRLCTGTSNLTGLFAGAVFEARGNANPDLDREYLVLSARHLGRSVEDLGVGESGQLQPLDTYSNSIDCIPITSQFRPALSMQRPAISGCVTATVVGPAGEEIWPDPHGRVRIHFHWDREGGRDEKSTCWVRVAQTWAGPGWGAMFVPRIGMEVVVQFIDGDPDQPVIIGCVYNGENPPPHPLPDEKTKSAIRTATSPTGAGFNELRLEDAAGSEEVYLHAQKDLNEEVEHDHGVSIKNDERLTIDRQQTEGIGADQTLTVKGNRTVEIWKSEEVAVHGGRTTSIDKDESVVVSGARTAALSDKESLEVDKDRDVYVFGARSSALDKDETHTVDKSRTTTLEGADVLIVSKDLSITGDKKIHLQQDKTTVVFDQNKLTINAGGEILIHNETGTVRILDDGSLQIKGDPTVEISAGGGCSIKLGSSGLTVTGDKVKINPGGNAQASSTAAGSPTQTQKPQTRKLSPMPGDTTFVEIELVDANGNPVPNEPFVVEFADGTTRRGRLGGNGKAHVPCAKAGSCKVTFPRLDASILQ